MRETREFKEGDVVELVNFTYGSGLNKIGDVGVIDTTQDKNTFMLNINGNRILVAREDIKLSGKVVELDNKANELYTQYISYKKNIVDRLKDSVRGLYREADELSKDYYNKMKSIGEMNTIIRSYKTKVVKLNHSSIRYAIKSLFEYYTQIELISGVLRGITKDVEIEYNKHKINLGSYVVDVYPTQVKIYTNREAIHDCIHPHIQTDNRICYGTWNESIQKQLAEGEYLRLLSTLYQFLTSINNTSWFIDVRYWLKDAEKRCCSCWEFADDCVCDTDKCEYCGLEDCECLRCPSNDERLPNGYDDTCRSCNSWVDDTCQY